jgi:hypothetical protein
MILPNTYKLLLLLLPQCGYGQLTNGTAAGGPGAPGITGTTTPTQPAAPGSIEIISPMPGSFWLAGADYRVRWRTDPNGATPSTFNVDLLTTKGELVGRFLKLTQTVGQCVSNR